MAYEVVKTIRGHRYRYSVESRRDEETGRVRNKWTYIGRADAQETPPVKRRSQNESRERIAAAFLRLIERTDWNTLTAAAIAREAGVSDGTFYRYFHSRTDVLDYCTARVNGMLDDRLGELHAIAPTIAQERARLRAWAIDILRKPPGPPALFRVWAAVGSPEIRKARYTRRIRAFRLYLKLLAERGYITTTDDHERIAVALSLIQQMFTRRSLVEDALLHDEEFAAVGETFERLVFFETKTGEERVR
jgi:AcrR family transcriptional regulator